jgi:hypothetical protein
VGQSNNGYPANWAIPAAALAMPLSASGQIAGWKRIWIDEFTAPSVVANGGTGKWFAPIHTTLGAGILATPPDKAIIQQGNYLFLQTRQDAVTKKWTDANVQTVDKAGNGFTFQNGYVEVSAALPTAHGSHAGIWLLSSADPVKGHTEIDIAESYGVSDGGLHQTVHMWPGKASTYPKHVWNSWYVNRTKVPKMLDGKMHRFGCLLTDTAITMFYDGVQTSSIARLPEQRVPLYILLSNFTQPTSANGWQPSRMIVDRVAVYQQEN